MDNDTDAALLLDLDGLAVARVERLESGTRRVHLVTADHSARACPACGVFAIKVKGPAVTRRVICRAVSGICSWCGTSGAGTAPSRCARGSRSPSR